jgi:hypothetical protein
MTHTRTPSRVGPGGGREGARWGGPCGGFGVVAAVAAADEQTAALTTGGRPAEPARAAIDAVGHGPKSLCGGPVRRGQRPATSATMTMPADDPHSGGGDAIPLGRALRAAATVLGVAATHRGSKASSGTAEGRAARRGAGGVHR